MKVVCLIMAGGKGERFWPRSRNDMPKQFLSIDQSGDTLIQKTVKRISPLVDIKDVFVITNERYVNIVKKQLDGIPSDNVISEPVGRNTAPAIGLSLEVMKRKYDDCVMIVLPSDHIILNEKQFISDMKEVVEFAKENDALLTMGIKPTNPNTGYGYIQLGDKVTDSIYKVNSFKEKPSLEVAKEYLASGQYAWNSGMFIWKLSSIEKALKQYLPNQYKLLSEHYGQDDFNDTFGKVESISIDYGVMEKAHNIYVINGDFAWDDVGSWLALERINKVDENNNCILTEKIEMTRTSGTTVLSNGDKLIATVGVKDLVIVETDDVVLVASKDEVSNVKEIIAQLKAKKEDKYL